MESNHSNKRKGLAKSKMLKSLYRGSAKPKPDSSSLAPTTAGFIIVKQDQVFPHHKPKVAFAAMAGREAKLDNFYGGGGGGGDEAVDAKATRYISTVQERFRLELINSEDFM